MRRLWNVILSRDNRFLRSWDKKWIEIERQKRFAMKVILYSVMIGIPFLVVDDSVFYGILVAAIGFFLVKFYTMVDELRKDVKQLLINESRNIEKIDALEEDVRGIKDHLDA